MPGADRIWLVFEQKMKKRPAEIVPQSHEIERLWSGNFFEAEEFAVEMPSLGHIGDENRAVIEMGHGKSVHTGVLQIENHVQNYDIGVPRVEHRAAK